MHYPHPGPADPTPLRALPQVQKLMESAAAADLVERFPRAAVVDAIRVALEALRRAVLTGEASLEGMCAHSLADSLFETVRAALESTQVRHLRRVINGTGIVIHTNLGRAPLAESAVAAVAEIAAGYSNLEFDLESGERGSRYDAVTGLCACWRMPVRRRSPHIGSVPPGQRDAAWPNWRGCWR